MIATDAPQRPAVVSMEIAELREEICAAGKLFVEFADRLNPVLRNDSGVTKEATNGQVTPSTGVPLGDQLRAARWDVEQLLNRIRDVLSRIEL